MYFDGNKFGRFDGWKSVAEYISNRIGDERILIIIDEFPVILKIFRDRSYLEIIGSEAAAAEIMEAENISNYMGIAFEQICCKYMVRMAKLNKLPFMPYIIGKWWELTTYLSFRKQKLLVRLLK